MIPQKSEECKVSINPALYLLWHLPNCAILWRKIGYSGMGTKQLSQFKLKAGTKSIGNGKVI